MPLVSIREAGEMLKLSMRTIQRMVAAHTLPSRLEYGRRLVLLGEGRDAPATGQAGPRDPRLLPHLFEVYEALEALRIKCLQTVRLYKQIVLGLQLMPDEESPPTLAQWEALDKELEACWRIVVPCVRDLRWDPTRLSEVYRRMLWVRRLWTAYAHVSGDDDREDEDGPGPDQGTDPVARCTAIIGHLRTLLIGSVTPGESLARSALS